MESDLKERIDAALKGAMFPQFSGEWEALLAGLRGELDVVGEDGGRRVRVGLCCKDPGRFVACFLSLVTRELDLFLWNPGWGENERGEAFEACSLDWLIEDASVSRLGGDEGRIEAKGLRLMIPTGGTGGRVTFAIHDWETLSAAVDGLKDRFEGELLSAHCVLPLYHVSGFMQLVRGVFTGGCVVLGKVESFVENHACLMRSQVGNCFLSLVPTQLERILEDESVLLLLREYRAIFIGGGPCSERLLDRAAKLGLPLAFSYGMTETGAQVVTLMPNEFLAGNRSAGRCLSHASVEVRDSESGKMLGVGEVGRVQVRASSLFRGYWGSEPFADEYYETSDFGVLDEGGYLSVLGRVDRVIISGGEKIDLGLVEAAIEETGLVSEVVAFGVADPEWGEVLAVAFVPWRSNCEASEIETALRGELATYRIPKIWRRLEELPRNEAGKVLRKRLLDFV